MTYIILITALFLDGIISTIVSENSYFIPHILLTTLFMIYPKYKNNLSTYNAILIITGIIYDLLYTNLLFFHGVIFFVIGKLIKYLRQNYSPRLLINIFLLVIVITSYILLISICLLFFRTTNITIANILNFIKKSLFLNILYLLLFNPIIKNKV